jgi:hypothetical protein
MDEAPEVRTGASGRFTIPGVPAGTRQVEVLAIGMLPVVAAVDVVADSTTALAAELRKVTTLDVVRVTGSRHMRRLLREFEERRRTGFGYFVDSTSLAARGTLSSVFFEAPSTRVEQLGVNRILVTLPATAGGRCAANVVIDGFKADHDQLNTLLPSDLAAVEVYPRRFSVPMRFMTNDACGAIVVWTKWVLR